jgi:2-haloalkanoic acid dehalogenase type II
MIDWRQVKALSFDCYGTLIDWERGILTALKPWVERFGERAVLAGFSACEPDIEHAHPTWPYRQVIQEVYRQMALELDMPASDDDALRFAVSVGTWPAFPDSVAALKRLARRFDLFILSNVDEKSISGTLALLDIDFAGVYTAEEIGSYKPDEANFRYLLERLEAKGVAPHEVVHVAQSLYHDHAPAKALGLTTVWVDRTSGRPGAARVPAIIPAFDHKTDCLQALADEIDLALEARH